MNAKKDTAYIVYTLKHLDPKNRTYNIILYSIAESKKQINEKLIG